jgi:hypothetical protein
MMNLPVGANLPLTGTRWSITIAFPQDIRHDLGLAILPLNESKHLVATPHLAHASATTWATISLNEAGTDYSLTLDTAQLPNANITQSLSATQIATQTQQAIWRVECVG